jgi:predicted acetyltransferase
VTERATSQTETVEALPATPEQQPIFANLLELYAYDFSHFLALELDETGRFGYRDLPLYWTDPDRYPSLVRVGGKLAGFTLVRMGSRLSGDRGVWDMAEFFVVRGYRRQGIGARVAGDLWRRFPGPWEVRVMEANISAVHFWGKAIERFAGHAIASSRIEKDGASWRVFRFSVSG